MSLNPDQRAAVDYRGGPLLVLAGAGTGKTRVITHRVAALLDEGIPPWRILAVTFTNKAAAEMRERIDRLCEGRHETKDLWVGTFHSICARILRRHGEGIGLSSRFSIYDPGDQAAVMRRVLENQKVPSTLYTPRGVLGHIDRAKNRGLGPREIDQLGMLGPVSAVVAEAYAEYQKRLLAADAVDFGDLLMHTVRLLCRALDAKAGEQGQLGDLDPMVRFLTRFQHVVVDEFQDTNPVQAELIDLVSRSAELCVVGDDDQAIYGWRGADVAQILSFGDRHAGTEVVRLEQNYRSTTNILRCADAVISKNRARLGKTLWSDLGEGEPVRVVRLETERDEARLVALEIQRALDVGADPEEFAVFYRTHAQSRVIEDEVRRAGLGCRIVGGVAFYERAEVKDVLSYLAVVLNPRSDAHVLRVINRPARGIGKTSQERLVAFAAGEGISVWEALQSPASAGLKKAACNKVFGFVSVIKDLQEVMDGMRLDELAAMVVEKTGYRAHLLAEDSDEAAARLENLQELLGNVIEFVEQFPGGTLAEYLERVSLVGGERGDTQRGRAVTLMTVHSAKGLEFEHVYLTGMEERVFPHARVLEDPVQLEEERRLAYVALTRAKRNLIVTCVARRRIFGQIQVGTVSRFARELPSDAIERVGAPSRSPSRTSRGASRPAEQRWNDDIVYDADPGIDPSDEAVSGEVGEGVELFVGMTMRHGKFGDGELVGWDGQGSKLKLHLRFEAGFKTVLARFCEPL